MEYVTKVDIFGLKMTERSGLEKIMLPSWANLFFIIKSYKIANSVIKRTFFAHGGIKKKCVVFSPSFLGQKYKF